MATLQGMSDAKTLRRRKRRIIRPRELFESRAPGENPCIAGRHLSHTSLWFQSMTGDRSPPCDLYCCSVVEASSSTTHLALLSRRRTSVCYAVRTNKSIVYKRTNGACSSDQTFSHSTQSNTTSWDGSARTLSIFSPYSQAKGLPCLTQARNARGKSRSLVHACETPQRVAAFSQVPIEATVRCKKRTNSSWVSAMQAARLTLAIPTRSADAKTMISTRPSSPQAVLRLRHKTQDASYEPSFRPNGMCNENIEAMIFRGCFIVSPTGFIISWSGVVEKISSPRGV